MKECSFTLRKKVLQLLSLCAVVVFMSAMVTMAAGKSQLSHVPKTTTYQLTKPITTYGIPCDKGGKIIKSSFKTKGSAYAKVTFNYNEYDKTYYVHIEPKKPGKASVSFNYKWKGKTTKYNFTFVIKKYVCPVASFKIGSKEYASAFKTDFKKNVTKTVSGKVSVKAKKGWKLLDIGYWTNSKYKEIKNGAKVKVSKGALVQVTFTKGKDYITCQINHW